MTTPLQHFCTGMHRHFKIRGANRFLDEIYIQLRKEVRLDVLQFDDWLHAQHGEYEAENLSMRDVITRHYGESAATFIDSMI
jgi:hypothetical protein